MRYKRGIKATHPPNERQRRIQHFHLRDRREISVLPQALDLPLPGRARAHTCDLFPPALSTACTCASFSWYPGRSFLLVPVALTSRLAFDLGLPAWPSDTTHSTPSHHSLYAHGFFRPFGG